MPLPLRFCSLISAAASSFLPPPHFCRRRLISAAALFPQHLFASFPPPKQCRCLYVSAASFPPPPLCFCRRLIYTTNSFPPPLFPPPRHIFNATPRFHRLRTTLIPNILLRELRALRPPGGPPEAAWHCRLGTVGLAL